MQSQIMFRIGQMSDEITRLSRTVDDWDHHRDCIESPLHSPAPQLCFPTDLPSLKYDSSSFSRRSYQNIPSYSAFDDRFRHQDDSRLKSDDIKPRTDDKSDEATRLCEALRSLTVLQSLTALTALTSLAHLPEILGREIHDN
jgi:hypothetical protein